MRKKESSLLSDDKDAGDIELVNEKHNGNGLSQTNVGKNKKKKMQEIIEKRNMP